MSWFSKSWLRNVRTWLRRESTGTRAIMSPRARLHVEALEERALMNVAPVLEPLKSRPARADC